MNDQKTCVRILLEKHEGLFESHHLTIFTVAIFVYAHLKKFLSIFLSIKAHLVRKYFSDALILESLPMVLSEYYTGFDCKGKSRPNKSRRLEVEHLEALEYTPLVL